MGAKDFDRLNEENYPMWSYRTEMVLTKMGLWEVTSGEVTRPMGSDNSKAVCEFTNKQKAARAELVLRVEDSQIVHTRYTDPAEIWTKLQTVHRARGLGMRMTLRRRFHTTEKQDDQTMLSYITEVQEQAAHLRELGAKIDDEEVIAILTKLPSTYDALVVSLDLLAPETRTIDYVITRLINEEGRQFGHLKSDAYTFAGQAVHRGLRPRKDTPLEKITCFHCQKKGHYKSDCPDLKNEPLDVSHLAQDINSTLLDSAY